jgi:hypothetical protein
MISLSAKFTSLESTYKGSIFYIQISVLRTPQVLYVSSIIYASRAWSPIYLIFHPLFLNKE